MSRNGNSLIFSGVDPVGTAELLRHVPGVSWLAVGFPVGSNKSLKRGASVLARKYLKPGRRFSVVTEVSGTSVPASDFTGAANFAILEAVEGARVDEAKPNVTFRVALDGSAGAIGVHIIDGPGGNPSGSERAMCLVSGGVHSSVMAWMALLAGYSVELVHAQVADQSLRAVARLYAELSHRADPSELSLRVVRGGGAPRRLSEAAAEAPGVVFGGFRATGPGIPPSLKTVKAPLWLFPEEGFESEFQGLALKAHHRMQDWAEKGRGVGRSRSFGGTTADVSRVLDGLR